ncbi:uncharacterized protein ARMOST_12262 [Armillaria ostoyae]|uniref:Uncharacterized protein n=1 Tax=Armillaria ostoyae TaxID=47428 RepID=A0A284RJH7_ARMOS|nr:uncharacterized protein ARMOST_12262 [Armillaria ostoyae]
MGLSSNDSSNNVQDAIDSPELALVAAVSTLALTRSHRLPCASPEMLRTAELAESRPSNFKHGMAGEFPRVAWEVFPVMFRFSSSIATAALSAGLFDTVAL